MKQQHDKDMEDLRTANAALIDERDRLRVDKTQAIEKLHAEYRAEKLLATDNLRARKNQQLEDDTANLKAQVGVRVCLGQTCVKSGYRVRIDPGWCSVTQMHTCLYDWAFDDVCEDHDGEYVV